MATIPSRFQPLWNQAQAEAFARYQPQRDALAGLLDQARQTYAQSVQQANSAAAILRAAATQASGQLNDPGNPLWAMIRAQQQVPGAESVITARNLGLTADAAQAQIAKRGQNAAEAATYQGHQALTHLIGDQQNIDRQLQSVANQYGTYQSGRYSSLVQADRTQRRQANQAARTLQAGFIKSGIYPPGSPNQGQVVPGGASDPLLSPSQQGAKARNDFFQQHGYYPPTGPPKTSSASGGAGGFLPRTAQLAQVSKIKGAFASLGVLQRNNPKAFGQTWKVTTLLRAGRVDGVKYTQPQIEVALDLFANGGNLSAAGVRRLNALGVRARGNFPMVARAPRGAAPVAPGPAGGGQRPT